MNKKNFLICGLTGWCIEILFTSVGCALHHDPRLIGQTSIWMFPIYGLAAVIRPIYLKIRSWTVFLRASVYSVGITSCEFIFGTFLKRHRICPWDYSGSKYSINGVIRLDYIPLWGLAGLVFERILCWQGTRKRAKSTKD